MTHMTHIKMQMTTQRFIQELYKKYVNGGGERGYSKIVTNYDMGGGGHEQIVTSPQHIS